MDGLLRVGDSCKNGYEDIIRKIRNSRWVHVDETGIVIRVNGGYGSSELIRVIS